MAPVIVTEGFLAFPLSLRESAYYLDWNTGVYFQIFSGSSVTSFPNMDSV